MEFTPWPKIPRLYNGELIVTEKLDGTNAQVAIFDANDDVLFTKEEEENYWQNHSIRIDVIIGSTGPKTLENK